MPLDGQITDFVKPDLTSPSLEGLAYLLEHPELWPEPEHQELSFSEDHHDYVWTKIGRRGWRWNFGEWTESCGTAGCAVGLANATWDGLPKLTAHSCLRERRVVAERFGLDDLAFERIFTVGSQHGFVTPAIVAGRIRDRLAGKPIRYAVEGDQSDA